MRARGKEAPSGSAGRPPGKAGPRGAFSSPFARPSAASVFAALGDGTRLTLVARLASSGPQSIARLASGAGVTRQAISKHLAVLAGAGLVHGEASGRERVFDLDTSRLAEARRYLAEISEGWDRALERLKEHVEG